MTHYAAAALSRFNIAARIHKYEGVIIWSNNGVWNSSQCYKRRLLKGSKEPYVATQGKPAYVYMKRAAGSNFQFNDWRPVAPYFDEGWEEWKKKKLSSLK